MADFKHQYCKCCQKKTTHTEKTYYDGTAVLECNVCRFRELIKKGYNYRNYERAIITPKS